MQEGVAMVFGIYIISCSSCCTWHSWGNVQITIVRGGGWSLVTIFPSLTISNHVPPCQQPFFHHSQPFLVGVVITHHHTQQFTPNQ
ncbi:hypothetical protein HanPI659440_Chr14g0546161 [Helianthus annuus]|nr:hypothetical protein HanPI659440_Chr14g0546161 [Helianthus annuus]